MEQNGPLRFGPYDVLEQIGAGGMGVVYRARDKRLEREVAIKVLHRHLEMAGARERFLREARAVSSLNHPNISTIFDIGEHDGDPYLVMELLHGESLKEYLEDGVPMPQDTLLSIAMQAAAALAAAHAKGIVHRDIKPANLFLVGGLAGEPQLKVLDFGLAKIERDRLLYGDSGGLTRTGSTVGTVEYMSPEQARGEPLDPRSDLFSLGAVLYEMATGDVPFRGATSAVVFAELLGSEPVPPRKANAGVSPGLDAVIRKLLVKDREHRTPSANALAEELRKLKEAASASATAATPSAIRPSEPPPPARAIIPQTDPTARAIRGRTPSGNLPSAVHKRASADRPSAIVPAAGREPLRDLAGDDRITSSAAERSHRERAGGTRWWIPLLLLLAVAGAAAAYVVRSRQTVGAGASVVTDGLQITPFQNSTGDALLQQVPAAGLQLLLAQMPSLHIAGYAPALEGAEIPAADLARRSGADVYLTGSVTKDTSAYHIHAELLRTSDGSRLAAEDVDAGSLVQIPDALSRLSVALRTHLGETPEQAAANSVPLTTEASASLNALSIYARGTSLLRAGQLLPAIAQFKQALADDASFVPARLELIEALRQAGAETERMQVAAPLRLSEAKGSACQRARITYELAQRAASMKAAQAWADGCGLQPESQIALARASLDNGQDGEAETAGKKAAELDPAGRAARMVATETMIAQAHYESASKEQEKAAALGVGSPGLALLANSLRGTDAGDGQLSTAARAAGTFWDDWYYITDRVDRGRIAEALAFGEAAAQRLASQPDTASAAALLRARLAAVEAMAGHCERTVAAAPNAGDSARYYAGLAAAWCHTPDTYPMPVDPALNGDVRAATAWSHGDANAALKALEGEANSSQSPIAALLRGEAHLALSQQVLAISDFKGVIARRGAALLTGTPVFPAAQAGLATAYRTMGDMPNAQRTADELNNTWKDASPGEPLLRAVNR